MIDPISPESSRTYYKKYAAWGSLISGVSALGSYYLDQSSRTTCGVVLITKELANKCIPHTVDSHFFRELRSVFKDKEVDIQKFCLFCERKGKKLFNSCSPFQLDPGKEKLPDDFNNPLVEKFREWNLPRVSLSEVFNAANGGSEQACSNIQFYQIWFRVSLVFFTILGGAYLLLRTSEKEKKHRI